MQSVLGSLTLGYRPLWGASRALAGIQLFIQPRAKAAIDAAHLLRTLQELWLAHSPPLLLSPQTPQLLCDFLEHAPAGSPPIEIRGDWLAHESVHARAAAAQRRGLKLVWRGNLAHLPDADTARYFDRSLLTLAPEDAALALKISADQHKQDQPVARRRASPVLAGQIYEGIASRALMEHCLDEQKAWALADWPSEDVLYGFRHQGVPPAHDVIMRLMKAIDSDQSLETFEQIMGEEPVLTYRFLMYTNSAALGLRTGIDSIRRGLMMVGYGTLKSWLAEQLPHATLDPNLKPIKSAMVLRALITQQILDAGVEQDLRREIYLSGLFSHLDLLMGEPLGTVLHRMPLSERIYGATVLHSGPYASSLEMACALESSDAATTEQLCNYHDLNPEEVNRALLRVLADLDVSHTVRDAAAR